MVLKESLISKDSTSQNNFLLKEIAQAIISLPSALEQSIFRSRKPISKHRHWNIDRYFELKKNGDYNDWFTLNDLLAQDFLTFTDEAVVPQYRTGPYNFTPKGLPNSYKEKSEVYSSNFIEQQHQSPSRAQIEAAKWQQLEEWLYLAHQDNTPEGETYIWFSPRGSVEEGYLGEQQSNPNLISVYIKENKKVSMYQYKTWSEPEQLMQTIQNLGYIFSTNFSKLEHNCIDSSGKLPTPVSLQEIEHYIYLSQYSEKPWPVTHKDLPTVDLDKFNYYREKVFSVYSFFLIKYLMNDSIKNNKTGYKKIILLLDTLFSVAIKTLDGWVYHNDQRSKHNSNYQTKLTDSVKNDSIEILENITQATPETIETLLTHFFYKLESLILNPELVTESELSSLSNLSKQLMLNIPMRVFSLGQCISLAPFSLAATTMVNFKGGYLPDYIAQSEGWLKREGLCARGEACISTIKGTLQNLGPCNWCFDCDNRFGHIRQLSKVDYRLFDKSKKTKKNSEKKKHSNNLNKAIAFKTINSHKTAGTESITLTQFLAGDYAAA